MIRWHQRHMRSERFRLVRLIVALCVTLSFFFMPVLSLQAMAAHHATGEITSALVVSSANQSQHQIVDGSCEQKSGTQSADEQMNCCEMNCVSSLAFETAIAPSFALTVSSHFKIDADQLTSRITDGLMRPPRA